jgi:HD-GYP domain-containing protein (c-di-GMP phosphodiesterase class II)
MESHVEPALADPDRSLDEKAKILYTTGTQMMREFLSDPMTDDLVPRTRNFANVTVKYLQNEKRAFQSFVTTASPTYSTHTHSINVGMYTLQLALRTGIDDVQLLEDIGVGTFLHDIGKCRVPARILNKPGKLDAAEWRTIRKHPMWGCQILSLHGLWSPVCIAIARDHHEKLDGTGYPFGKTAQELPDYVRMTTISDVFDAISTTRCYKEGLPSFRALETMRDEMTGQVDGKLFSEFVKMLNL